MFGIGLPELIVIFIIALLIFGPKRLPELGQTLGKWISEMRKATQDLSDNIQEDIKRDIPERKMLPPKESQKTEEKDRDTSG
jgi:sec-independent protein translocase protein TatA